MTQEEFAAAVGVSRGATVSDWERGGSIPPAERLREIAEVAGEAPEDVFGGWAVESIRSGEDDAGFRAMLAGPLPTWHGLTATHLPVGAEPASTVSENGIERRTAEPCGDDLARQIDAVLEMRLSGVETTALVAEIRAAYGMAAMRELAEAVGAAERGSALRSSSLVRYLSGGVADIDDDPRTATPMSVFSPADVLGGKEEKRRKAGQ